MTKHDVIWTGEVVNAEQSHRARRMNRDLAILYGPSANSVWFVHPVSDRQKAKLKCQTSVILNN